MATVNCDKCGRLLPEVEGFEGDYTCDFCITHAAMEEEIEGMENRDL